MAPGLTPRTPGHINAQEMLREPQAVAERLVTSGEHYGLTAAEVRYHDAAAAVLWLTLDPWAPMAAEKYPTERVAITVRASSSIMAVPVGGADRTWLHRNARVPFHTEHVGELCLWFPGDPRPLRWEWADGFDMYVTIVHRHLQAEEFFRRNGVWPSEDAPHGAGPHPIRTEAMRRIADRGAA